MRKIVAVAAASAGALALAAGASAHAHVSPPIVEKGTSNQFTVVVPTEKEGVTTTKVELTMPQGFAASSFEVPPAPWKLQVQKTGTGDEAVVQKMTWTNGNTPTDYAAVFRFQGSSKDAKTFTFPVRQTYSDGSVVDWSGPESSDTPAPAVEVKSSLGGGGGTSVLAIVALVVGAAGLAVGVAALLARGSGSGGGGRQLA
jgi:uncharacterized protein YcnI